MSRTNRAPWKESKEIRDARVKAEFGKFRSKTMESRPTQQQERKKFNSEWRLYR